MVNGIDDCSATHAKLSGGARVHIEKIIFDEVVFGADPLDKVSDCTDFLIAFRRVALCKCTGGMILAAKSSIISFGSGI